MKDFVTWGVIEHALDFLLASQARQCRWCRALGTHVNDDVAAPFIFLEMEHLRGCPHDADNDATVLLWQWGFEYGLTDKEPLADGFKNDDHFLLGAFMGVTLREYRDVTGTD